MSLKIMGYGVAGAVLLAPGAVLMGITTLIAPGATASAACLTPSHTANQTPASLTGSVPSHLTATTSAGTAVELDRTQLERAATIPAVGISESIPAGGQLTALDAAFTESQLRVLANPHVPGSSTLPHDGTGSDHDSVGLFQMRPSAGWGTPAELMNPVWSARAFYGGPDGPNRGNPRGLLDLPGWTSLTPNAAAQAVEGSNYPTRYATNLPVARTILTALSGNTATALTCASKSTNPGLPAHLPPGFAGAFIAAAAKEIGLPYVWGGGDFLGPTGGGFDCSGLVLYAAYQASNGKLRLPHFTGDQLNAGTPIAWDSKQAGDLIFFTYPGASQPHHVAIYLGGNQILQAPQTGENVRVGTVTEFTGQTTSVRRLP